MDAAGPQPAASGSRVFSEGGGGIPEHSFRAKPFVRLLRLGRLRDLETLPEVPRVRGRAGRPVWRTSAPRVSDRVDPGGGLVQDSRWPGGADRAGAPYQRPGRGTGPATGLAGYVPGCKRDSVAEAGSGRAAMIG